MKVECAERRDLERAERKAEKAWQAAPPASDPAEDEPLQAFNSAYNLLEAHKWSCPRCNKAPAAAPAPR